MKKDSTTVILVESALMIALSAVLELFKLWQMPMGGSVTCASVPLVLLSFHRGPKWGIGAAFTHSLLQMLLRFDAPPAKTFGAFAVVILLDYVIAFTALGAASFFGKPFKNRTVSVAVGTCIVSLIRLLCSFTSGCTVWKDYTPEGWPVWFYSLTYNATYMLPQMVITAVLAVVFIHVLDRFDGRKLRPASN
ncbi:energy-coupled thiamine transporter ThiT [Clostridium sp. D33t1_170424_F3]|uniref:energy-coupled thiamine transporter ThiT n=1 Tax=Clostridium sp. D33t1_170424_F3 TaxID=2787099 RepID=UPI0018AAC727|nr:energy-coupled thiamine transporter ThiT [Clostridium sp. D33t1_170424_F3]